MTEPDTAATEAPVATKKTSIVLEGTGTYGCYVEVRGKNAKGRLVVQRILAPGDSVEFKVLNGIWVRATNPAELKVTIARQAGVARQLHRRHLADHDHRGQERRLTTGWRAPRAAILVTGDEILRGRIQERNAGILSRSLESHGVEVDRIEMVGDGLEAIGGALGRLLAGRPRPDLRLGRTRADP